MIKPLLVTTLLAGTATADPIGDSPALDLSQALRYSGIKPASATAPKFRVASVACEWTFDKDPVLGDHACKLDKIQVKGVAAYLLYQTLVNAGAPTKQTTPTVVELSVTNLWCVVDPSQGMEQGSRCDWDGSKPRPVTITPKKRPVKDIVQPVKIEKQK